MFIDYRVTVCILALAAALIIFRLIRRNHLHAYYALWWILAGVFVVLLGLFPTIFDEIGHALGVTYPPTLFIVIVLLVIAIRMLLADVERTRMELTQRRLVQRYALLALKLRAVERVLRSQGVDLPKFPDPEDEAGVPNPEPSGKNPQSPA